MGGIPSQCVCISNHHDVHFKFLTVSFLNYASIKLKGKKDPITEKKKKKLSKYHPDHTFERLAEMTFLTVDEKS